MSTLIARGDQKQKYPILEAGGYIARCYAIIDIGEQYSPMFSKSSRKVTFIWEIPSETIDVDGEQKPRAISETYTLSLGEKSNMRKMLENWRGRAFTAGELEGFDLEKVLGVACMLNVIHKQKQNGETFAAIGSVSKLPKGMGAPELVNPAVLFSLDDANALDKMKELPEWIQNRIRESATYKALTQPDKAVTDASRDEFEVIDGGNDIPF